MDTQAVRLIQQKLKEMGLYHDAVDGQRGPNTHRAAAQGIAQMPGAAPPDIGTWSDKRKAIAFLQLWCHAEGIDAGRIDGWWGPQTGHAAAAMAEKVATGLVHPWRDVAPSSANPNGWPTEAGVTAFYGPHGAADWSRPPPVLVKVPSPYPLRIAWNLAQKRSFLWAHEKTAASVARVLAQVLAHYGAERIRDLRIDVFSGDYFPRKKKGSATQWSMHAWGIAYDFDDTNNQLHWGADRAQFARPEYIPFWEAWEAEGWVSLGRARNFDWMHVQAARV